MTTLGNYSYSVIVLIVDQQQKPVVRNNLNIPKIDSLLMSVQYTVHRWRHPEWVPAPIRSIAADPITNRVAIGREDGQIEICCSLSKWHSFANISGVEDFGLQALSWSVVNPGRLFGISLRGFLFEIDLSELSTTNIRDCYGGSAWCLSTSLRKPILAVGCEDGTARLFTYENDKQLEYFKTIPTTGSRVLCIAFHPTSPTLFMGCADGTIRCVDESSGRAILRMTGEILRGVPTQIWSIKVLRDSTVITGDSRGHVQFWDGNVGVLMATIQQHTAEILTIAVSADETQVFASGTDSRVTCMKKVNIPPSLSHGDKSSLTTPADLTSQDDSHKNTHISHSPASTQWVHTTAQRPHSHDVFALAVVEDPTDPTSGSVLLSGGMDCKLCVYSLAGFSQLRPSWILPVPARGLVESCFHDPRGAAGWSMVRHRNHLDIWSLKGRVGAHSDGYHRDGDDDDVREHDSVESACEHILRLDLNDSAQTVCSAMALRGIDDTSTSSTKTTTRLITCASTASGTKMWSLSQRSTGGQLVVKRINLQSLKATSCNALALTPDGRIGVFATSRCTIVLMDIAAEDPESSESEACDGFTATIRHTFFHRSSVEGVYGGGKGNNKDEVVKADPLEYAISNVRISSDCLWLAVSDASAKGRVYIYDLDRLRLHWVVPRCAAPVADLGFHLTTPTSLVIVLTDNTFQLQDVMQQSLCPWSKLVTIESMPDSLKKCPGPLQGLCFVPDHPNAMILHGQGFFVYVDLSNPVPKKPLLIGAIGIQSASAHSKDRGRGKKRKNVEPADTNNPNFAMVHRYRGLTHVRCLEGGQLVMVENPWLGIVDQLPDTLARKRYAT